jgi:hypothetical protein
MNPQNILDIHKANSNFCYHLSSVPEFSSLGEALSNNLLKLNKVSCRSSNNQEYTVIRYDKNLLRSDLHNSYGLIRSVILNKDNQVVSFSPPKSICPDKFIKLYTDNSTISNLNDVIAEEFVEGTMINVFWDKNIGLSGGWEISTRNTVGATSKFYKSLNSKTFREMFLESAKANNLILDNLNHNYCYSFVMQHPENRIVVPFKESKLFLIAIYYIDNRDISNICVYSMDIEKIKETNWYDAAIYFPKKYSFTKYADLIDKYASMNTSYDILGVVIHNTKTGERTKIRNPVYEQVRSLRGNQPKLQYQYLCLRKEGKVREFLNFYPEFKKEFSSFRDQVHLFTETLYGNYASCYIKKQKPLIQFTDQFRTHMYNIHQIFMTELRENKKFVTNTLVIKYVNELHPSLLMYCLNYNMRKRNIDYNTVDIQI